MSFVCRCTIDEFSGGEPSSAAFDPSKICAVDALGLLHAVCALRTALTCLLRLPGKLQLEYFIQKKYRAIVAVKQRRYSIMCQPRHN